MRTKLVLLGLALAAGFGLRAEAAPILPGNTTNVTLTSASTLTSFGIGATALGSATIDATGTFPIVRFPITGGSATGGVLQIQHNGSGLELSSTSARIDLTNFLVDTGASTIFANVATNGGTPSATQVGVFAIGTGLALSLTATGASALDTTFATSAFTAGTAIGTATTNPIVATPEPTSLALIGAGMLALVGRRRHRRPTTQAV